MLGPIIAYEAKLQRDRKKELTDISAQLVSLERDYRPTLLSAKLD